MEALRFPVKSHFPSTSAKIRRFKLKLNHSILYPPKPKPPIRLCAISNFASIKCSAHSNHHHHHHDHHNHSHGDHHNHGHGDQHHHGHSHSHSHGGGDANLTKSQQAFLRFAEAVKWTDLANFLREHLELCCCAAVLFIVAGACPYLLPKPAVRPLQHAFTAIAFPLVGISASLDAVIDIV